MNFNEFTRLQEFRKNFPNLTNSTEAPVTYWGDYNFKMAVDAITGISLKWKLKGKIKTHRGFLDVFKHNTLNIYIVGEFLPLYDDADGLYFGIYCELHIREDKVKGKVYHAVKVVKVKDENESLGIATELYKFLSQKEKLTLISVSAQFFGARKLWSSLSKKFVVDVLDIESGEVVAKNVKLTKEMIDDSFEKEFWSGGDSQDYSKEDIRFILRF